MKDQVRKLTAAERKKLSALIEQIDRKDEAAWRETRQPFLLYH